MCLFSRHLIHTNHLIAFRKVTLVFPHHSVLDRDSGHYLKNCFLFLFLTDKVELLTSLLGIDIYFLNCPLLLLILPPFGLFIFYWLKTVVFIEALNISSLGFSTRKN